jgi:predicted translin family RNA/ssDNA-binding protein
MLDKKYFAQVRASLLDYSAKRREMIKQAGDAQNLSKKAIFAMQRDDIKEAGVFLSRAGQILLDLNKVYKTVEGIFEEGSYKAGLEEFVEASIFAQFLAGKNVGKISGLKVDSDIYVSGLCDVPGELLRYAIKSATERKFEEVKLCHTSAEKIIGELVDMDLTGYNRQKFDQAKQSLHRLEQIVYEVSMKSQL